MYADAFVYVCDCVGALNGAAVCLFSVLCVCYDFTGIVAVYLTARLEYIPFGTVL